MISVSLKPRYFFSMRLIFERGAAAAATPGFRAVGQNLYADARVLVAGWAQDHHVRDVHLAFLIQNAAANILRRIRARVLLDHVGVLDSDAALDRIDREDPPGFAFVAAGHDFHRVSVANHHRPGLLRSFSMAHGYQTSGASEMIFVNFFSRNSRATGPNTRVPTGSPASLMSTAALSSKRM